MLNAISKVPNLILKKYSPMELKNETLSGVTVAIALVPEAIAFSLVAHVNPLVGLYAAFIVGLLTSFFGGRPGMISGATGALAVVMVGLVVNHGVEYLFATVVLMGILQILFGLLKLGKFIRIVPHPVFLGFVNGLAIVILLAQFEHFKAEDGHSWIENSKIFIMLGFIALTMAIIYLFPKITKFVPSTLVAIIVGTAIAVYFNIDTKTVKEMGGIAGGLPSFHIPSVPFSLETLYIILPYSLVLAMIGLLESLLTLSLVDEMTQTQGKPNKECVGQGIANTVTGFFGGMGGCAMIGQSMINVNSGGKTRLSSFVAAGSLLIFILFASGIIEQIPVAVLVGVMAVVVIGTFNWKSLFLFSKVKHTEIFITFLVTIVTVFTNLAVAVLVGIIVSALVFAWQYAKHIHASSSIDSNTQIKTYKIDGVLFFASTSNFLELFSPKTDPKEVYINFASSKVMDHSAIEAIDKIAKAYSEENKILHLTHLSPECRQLLSKAKDIVEVNVIEDPNYHVADDKLN